MGDGDGWVHCAEGHRHWGRFGAAGLLLSDGSNSVLQHRAPWTHEGGTWGLPGGARDSHEGPVEAAVREAGEEAAIAAPSIIPIGLSVDDHGGWSYTTVLANASGRVIPHAANAESTEVRWWADADIEALPLHRGLASSWPRLRPHPRLLELVIDAANVIGSRPDGWWRDRLSANRKLQQQLLELARRGVSTARLPAEFDSSPTITKLPHINLVVEGVSNSIAEVTTTFEGTSQATSQATSGMAPPGAAEWWQRAVTTVASDADADSVVVRLAGEYGRAGRSVVVVSADRGLRAQLPPGTLALGPSWLRDLLERTAKDHPSP